MSRPACTGTVVARPSGCRNCLWEPRCRTSTKPNRPRRAITSRGFSTGGRVTLALGDEDRLGADEFRFQRWLSVLKEH
jgi:hypothetical protein